MTTYPERAPVARTVIAAAIVIACTVGFVAGQTDDDEGPNEAEMRRDLLREAWGPESPETLQTYLDIRRAVESRFREHEDAITQLALRNAATRPVIGKAILGAGLLRGDIERELKEVGWTYSDFVRLNALVYGRWLRAVREGDPPEKRVVRVLSELQLGLRRQLDNNPPDNSRDLQSLRDELSSVEHQIEFLVPFAEMDKAVVLETIDEPTKAWLSEHREEIEELDFGYFDTVPPPRPD